MESAPGGVVAEGRDITTVVYPPIRILVTARPEVRMMRRRGDLGETVTEEELRDQVLRRDRDDSALVEFQTAAPGVHLLDNSDMSAEETVAAVVALAEEAGA